MLGAQTISTLTKDPFRDGKDGGTPQDERNAAQTVTLWAKRISLPRDKT